MKCPYCEKTHPVPAGYEWGLENYTQFYLGEIHNLDSDNVLITDGYSWYNPKEYSDLGSEYTYVLSTPENIHKAEFQWSHWHGHSGHWHKMEKSDIDFAIQIKNFGTIIAFKL
jgi:hypothetical protein